MDVLIIGAGDVGSNLARDLADTHDLTLIDQDSDRVDTLTSDLDVAGAVGDGRSVSTLREAGIDQADIVIASTDSDAANVMVCNAAKRASDPHTIARVKDVGLFQAWESFDRGLGIETMLCIDLLAAQALVRTLALPGAQAVNLFADGLAEVAEFEIGENTPVTDCSVAEADQYPSVTFAAILREGDILIPEGETVIRAGDCVIVIGSPHGVSRFAEAVSAQSAPDPDDDIVVVGGDALGFQVAQLLEKRGLAPEVIERDPDRAVWLANHLRESTVVEADATDVQGIARAHLTGADLVIGAVDDDTNYLLAQLAHELGVARTATFVDEPDVVELFEETGLDLVIHPEDIIASEILQIVYHHKPQEVSVLEHDKAEVLELVVDEESRLTGKSLRGLDRDMPSGFVIGAVIRGNTLRTPRGGTIIQSGDKVIAFIDTNVADKVIEMI